MQEEHGPAWLYDGLGSVFGAAFTIFFREVHVRGSHHIPDKGPVIFVGAPHANQFVDPMLIIVKCLEAKSHRRVSILIAMKSWRELIVGTLAKWMRAIPVDRAQDNLKLGTGEIWGDEHDTMLVHGSGTKFTREFKPASLLNIPGSNDMAHVKEILSDTELVLSRTFKNPKSLSRLAKGPTKFKFADHVDNGGVFRSVFQHLAAGHCLGVFPEGGSHDRTDLLPLKPGVAIMALGTLADHPDLDLTIIPVGLNYFHAHKFRSRAVIHYGAPFKVPKELVEEYREGGREGKTHSAGKLLSQIAEKLETVAINCPDYDTLMVVQACQRLYRPSGHIPLAMVIEFTRRFLYGFNIYKDDPRVKKIYRDVQEYNKMLMDMGLKDHQVAAAVRTKSQIFWRLVRRTIRITIFALASLPGLVIGSPILIMTKWYSKRKADAALKKSTVKIKARDIMATWKILVGLFLTPMLYSLYSLFDCWFVFSYKRWLPFTWTNLILVFYLCLFGLFALSYTTLFIAEAGVGLARSLWPLYLALSPTLSDTLARIREMREGLRNDITELVHELLPELFPDGNIIGEAEIDPQDDPRTDLSGLKSSLDLRGDYDLNKVPLLSTSEQNQTEQRDESPSIEANDSVDAGQTSSAEDHLSFQARRRVKRT